MALLTVNQLSVHFGDEKAPFKAVDRISYTVNEGEVLGIVGESGSGKSVSPLAIMGLIDFPGRVSAQSLEFNQHDLLALKPKEKQKIIGADVSMIFQDAMTSLNPSYTVGFQITEALKVHQGGSKASRRARAIELLTMVGIPDPESRLEVYPHQLSGGMSQRVMIAMAIACNPKLLIADEPTTALDALTQFEVLKEFRKVKDGGTAMVFITHDLGVASYIADRIVVMNKGRIVDTGTFHEIVDKAKDQYTRLLIEKKTAVMRRYEAIMKGGAASA